VQSGIILIGEDDNGNEVGVQNTKKLLEDIPNNINEISGIATDVNSHQTE
jgi:ATP-dependent DNA helicase RecG